MVRVLKTQSVQSIGYILKKGDVVNFSGYMRMREEMTEYKHNGESTMAPVLVPIVEECELLE